MNLLEGRFEIRESRSIIEQIGRRIKAQAVMLLYWSAILLPVIYLSLLITRIHSVEKLVLFLALVGLHLIALIGGKSHRRTIDP